MTLGNQLGSISEHLFVGRHDELAAVDDLLCGSTKRPLLYFHGMGGIGKTELLRAIRRRTRESLWEVVLLDARELATEPAELTNRLRGNGKRPRLLMLDSFESLAELERPLREQVLPALPSSCRVVLAGRRKLDPAWTADPGWSASLRVVALGELSPAEASHYLRLRRLEPESIARVLALAGGFPLALALAASSDGHDPARILDEDPTAVEHLLTSIVDRAPSPAHHRVLAASALVRRTTEELVCMIVGEERAPELFEWLATRSGFRADVDGLFPHTLVRHLLVRRLQWQRPDLVLELLLTAAEYHARRAGRRLDVPAAATALTNGNLPSARATADAVRVALKRADRPDTLAGNPLLGLRVVAEHTTSAITPLDRGRVLIAYLRHLAAEALASPRDELQHRALVETYFAETRTKGLVIAANLGMGYSTYRRYVATAIERVATTLLQHEIAARGGAHARVANRCSGGR